MILCFLNVTKVYSASFECHLKIWNKNGYYKSDIFAWSYVEINTWLKKMTFFPFKPSNKKRNEGIKFKTLDISKKGSSYKSEKFKQRKLTENESKFYKDKREYVWNDVKDEYLEIWISNIDSNPIQLEVNPVNFQKINWVERYDCYKPR